MLQMYTTLWSRQLGHRPISVLPQLGQGKKVVLLPISLTPQELQIFSFSMALAEAGLCFIYLYVSGKRAGAKCSHRAGKGRLHGLSSVQHSRSVSLPAFGRRGRAQCEKRDQDSRAGLPAKVATHATSPSTAGSFDLCPVTRKRYYHRIVRMPRPCPALHPMTHVMVGASPRAYNARR